MNMISTILPVREAKNRHMLLLSRLCSRQAHRKVLCRSNKTFQNALYARQKWK